MPRSRVQPTHILKDDQGREVGQVVLTDAGRHEVHLVEGFDARATVRLRMVRSVPVRGGGRPPPDRSS